MKGKFVYEYGSKTGNQYGHCSECGELLTIAPGETSPGDHSCPADTSGPYEIIRVNERLMSATQNLTHDTRPDCFDVIDVVNGDWKQARQVSKLRGAQYRVQGTTYPRW